MMILCRIVDNIESITIYACRAIIQYLPHVKYRSVKSMLCLNANLHDNENLFYQFHVHFFPMTKGSK